ncbi:hypothetical protein BaRGS_00023654 [Batillaria attramentaria]|uniref:protein-tyrosine-phosphatase n=1 Tax=Batillaria attramentaria TaxID=370345 RepID=A0ABD0KDD5_9CAEN
MVFFSASSNHVREELNSSMKWRDIPWEDVRRMSERVITVDGVECYRFPNLTNEDPRKQTVNCTQGVLNGTIVRLARDRNTGQYGGDLAINLCCSDEYWGNDCSKRCGDCHSGAPCDKVTGYCEECEAGSYGINCSSRCGACSNDNTCNHVNGSCDQCMENFALPLCKVAVTPSTTTARPDGAGAGDNAANTGDGPPIPVIAGSVVGGVVFLVLALILLVFLIRRRRSSGKKPDEVRVMQRTDVTTDHANPVYQNVRDPDSGPVSRPDTTDEQYARPTALVKPHPLPRSKPRPAQAGHMYENVGVNGEVYPRPSRRSTANMADTDAGDDVDALETADDTRAAETAYYNDPVYMTSQAATLGLDRNLPYGHQRDHEVGSKEENRSKNRFNSSILPYDATRVVLHGNSGPDSNDYINASYVRGFSNKTYIAAQGPKTNSVGDFWRMVWQEKITHIVMLTNLKEAGKNKCVEYWPRKGKHCKYSSVDVTGLEVEQRADCVIRTFDVKRSGGGPSRHVTQYHYVTWPDHSVPTATALVDFWRTVTTSHRNQQSPSPLLVHCSAGVGRTGTFISLDIAMDGAQKQSEIDIFAIVQRMREDRVNMVQTKSQYRFVHEAILEAYTSRHTRLALLTFNSVFPFDIDPIKTNDRIDSEFKLLNQMKVLLHKPSHTVAENEENIGKNRTLDILPDDSHLACLSSPVRGRNQYINGVFVSTFFSRRGCIMTQLPLYHTMVDIWRLVDGNDVTTIVSLGAEVDGPEADCCYWPRQEGQSKEFGPFTVTLSSKAILGQHLTSYMLSLQSRNHSYDREVYVLQYSGDGATKSGLFRAVCDVISRMSYDRDVDVYMAVRHVQIARPESVQYRYLYHVIQEHQKRNAVYNNA